MADDAGQYRNTTAPLGANEKVAPIKLTHTTLRTLASQGPAAIRMAAALAGQDERKYLPLIKTGVEADMELAQARAPRPKQPKVIRSMMAKGDTVYDTEHQKRVVIMKESVGYTAKGRPIHRVMARSGKTWLQKESKLKPLS